jgi:hypothetical protein
MPEQPTTIAELKNIGRLRQYIEQVAATILDERQSAVLWIGAGLSKKYGGLPTWTDFLKKSTSMIDTPDAAVVESLIASGRMSMAAEYLSEVLGSKFIDALVETFSANLNADLPDCLGYWGIRDVITTNYDLLLERRFPNHRVMIPSFGMRELLSPALKLVKLHGSIDKPESCVASISSYVKNYDNNLEWYIAQTFSTHPVIFFGSSMSQSEPFFKIIRLLAERGEKTRGHFCILPVRSSDDGKAWAKMLSQYGIELIPYIPDNSHSFLTEFFDYIEEYRSSRKGVALVLDNAKSHLEKGRVIDAGLALQNVFCFARVPSSVKKKAADILFNFFQTVSQERYNSVATELAKTIKLADLVLRLADFISDDEFLSGKGLRNLHSCIELLHQQHNQWGIQPPPFVKRKYDELVDRWENSGKKHARERLKRFDRSVG